MRPVVEPLRHALVAAMRALHLRAVVPRPEALRLHAARGLRKEREGLVVVAACARLGPRARRGALPGRRSGWRRRHHHIHLILRGLRVQREVEAVGTRLGARAGGGAQGRGLAREGLLPHGLRLGAIAALPEAPLVRPPGALRATTRLGLHGAHHGVLEGAHLSGLAPHVEHGDPGADARPHRAAAEHREALQARGLVVQPLRHARVAARGALHLHPLGRHVASTGRGVRQRHAGEEGATGQKAGECRTRGAQQAWPGPKWLGRRWG
mmetsp:Transcript_100949/g.282973  ORF Transcript_100949/g.282973 Transcript_100949/m.282973 type:complete len:267 (+) Transcript_100949:407-1207(+)